MTSEKTKVLRDINYEILGVIVDDVLDGMIKNPLYIKDPVKQKEYLDNNAVTISTITIYAKLGVKINNYNIARYIELSKYDVFAEWYGNAKNENTNRHIFLSKNSEKKLKKKQKKKFYNQVTLEVRPYGKEQKNRIINVKLFKNGSVQMTGCKCMTDCYKSLQKIVDLLISPKYKITGVKKIELIEFIDDIELIKIDKMKIAMINSNFYIEYMVNLEKLYYLLCTNAVKCKYNPIHACVNIKYNNVVDLKEISIFVFQSGSIIITGASNVGHIITTHNYILGILEYYKKEIIVMKMTKTAIRDLLKTTFPEIIL